MMSFDEFIEMACRPRHRSVVRRLVDSLLAIVSPRHRKRLAHWREQERAWPEQVASLRAICAAMTPEERREPKTVDHTARQRIAAQAGVDPFDVSQVIRSYQSYRRAIAQLQAVEQNTFGETT